LINYKHLSTIRQIEEWNSMARTKSKRELTFKPKFKNFAPSGVESETIKLLHEEIEAIYLMDHKELYQEDAALSMGVSRTTFSRIIKSARKKVAMALINGKALYIQDEKAEYSLAFICDDEELFGNLSIKNQYLIIVKIENENIRSVETVLNPIYKTDLKPTHFLPEILSAKEVNYFIVPDAGEGLKNSLLTKGIFIINKSFLEKQALQMIITSLL